MKRKLDALAESVPSTPPTRTDSDSAKRPRPSPPDAVHHCSFAPSPAIECWLDNVSSDHSSIASAAETPPLSPPLSRRSRSSSPSRKWPNEPLYRRQNIRQANIAFTFFDEIPKHIQDLTSTLSDDDKRLQSVKETFIVTARRLETKGAAEGDWRAAFERLVEDLLAVHGLSTELEVVTEGDWLPELKPEPWTVSVPVLVPQKRASAPLPSTDPPALPLSRLTFELKTPRPDIFVAFSESSFSSGSLLDPLQAGGALFSDPTTSLGIRFPFLLIETKSAATGGSLYHAQNQAAVGGACMLNALKRLGELSQLQDDGSPPTSLASTPMAFSILSSSSLVEVWIHYWSSPGIASTPHSSCLAKLAVFDCTMGDGCESFLRMLSGIIRWGVRELKMWCNETLDTIAASSAG